MGALVFSFSLTRNLGDLELALSFKPEITGILGLFLLLDDLVPGLKLEICGFEVSFSFKPKITGILGPPSRLLEI